MEIHWHHADGLGAELRAGGEERLRALAQDHSDLIDVRISARTTEHHRHGGREIRIACQARGREIVVARTRADLAQAFQEALDAFEREVRRMRERRTDRRVERPPEPPVLGVVDRIVAGEGYGFILTDAGDRVYFHRNAVSGGLSFDALEEGRRVGLNVEPGEKGPQATVVVTPPPDVPSP